MKEYKVRVLSFAYSDTKEAKKFYELQAKSLGKYFLDSILTDIDSLSFYAGIHPKIFGFYRVLAKRFPYAIYYEIEDDTVLVYAVLDQRRNPQDNFEKLGSRL